MGTKHDGIEDIDDSVNQNSGSEQIVSVDNPFSMIVTINRDDFYRMDGRFKFLDDEKETAQSFADEYNKDKSLAKKYSNVDEYVDSMLKQHRKNLLANKYYVARNQKDVEEIGKCFLIKSETAYYNMRKKFTFLDKNGKEVCFLRTIESSQMETTSSERDLGEILSQFSDLHDRVKERDLMIAELKSKQKDVDPNIIKNAIRENTNNIVKDFTNILLPNFRKLSASIQSLEDIPEKKELVNIINQIGSSMQNYIKSTKGGID